MPTYRSSIIRACGYGLVLLALAIMAGWHLRSPRLIHILSGTVPMQYNTALAILVGAIALLAQQAGRTRIGLAGGAGVAALAGLTLAQYVVGADFGIDRLLVEPFTRAYISHPGRMAPTTSLALLLIGGGLAMSVRAATVPWVGHARALCAAVALTLALAAIAGYALGVAPAYGWTSFTRMAFPTALAVAGLALGLLLLPRAGSGLSDMRLLRTEMVVDASLLALAIGLIIPAMAVMPMHQRIEASRRQRLMLEVEERARALEDHLGHLAELAHLVGTRTRARDLVGEWRAGRLPLAECRRLGDVILGDALRGSNWLRGVTRSDGAGTVLATAGDAPPALAGLPTEPAFDGMVQAGDATLLLMRSPVLDDQRRAVAIDHLRFATTRIRQVLAQTDGEPFPCSYLLVDGASGRVVLDSAGGEAGLVDDAPAAELVRGADGAINESITASSQPRVVARSALSGLPWTVVGRADRAPFYADPSGEFAAILGLILATALVASGGMVLLLRPFGDAILVRSGTLEQMVAEQTRELQRRNEELRRSNHDLDEFAYITSHDLREPLRGMAGYAQILAEDHGPALDAGGQGAIASILRLSKRMDRLIADLLACSRVGRAEFAMGPTDLEAALAEVLDDLRHALIERGLEIRRAGTLPTLVCDAVRVKEVLRNLVANAIKYRDQPGGWIRIGYQPAHVPGPGEELPADLTAPVAGVFSVADDGIGIRPQHREAVFQIFKRMHRDDEYGGGSGIGLTIVRSIVERHAGRVWLVSGPDHGTTFFFTLKGTA